VNCFQTDDDLLAAIMCLANERRGADDIGHFNSKSRQFGFVLFMVKELKRKQFFG
jgi:hypothetical protein